MADSWLKKERTKKKQQEKQQKAERKLERKEQARNGNKLETMLAYVDENGNITSQPQLHKRAEINAEDIEIGVAKHEPNVMEQTRKGIVSFFNQSKGFGFIRDIKSGESIFVHEASLTQPIKENNRVSFETEKGPKGLNAVNVKLV